MKNFFSSLLATITGIILSSIVLFVIFIGMITAIVASQDKAVVIKPKSVLVLKFDQQIVDRKPVIPFSIDALRGNKNTGLNEILANIRKAKEDKNIEGIYLNLSVVPAGISTIEEIRNELIDFRNSGKFVIAHADIMTQGSYYLATAANEVYLNPVGLMEWVGMRIQSPFFKKTLDKLDIEATVIRYGKYKSAAENFTEEGFSKENREQLHTLISSLWDYICKRIAIERNIPVARLNEIAENLLLKTPYSAVELGMIDSLLYENEVIEILKSKSGLDLKDDLRSVSLSEYAKVGSGKKNKGIAKNKIAVIYASGDIFDSEGSGQVIQSDNFARAIRKARKDSSIKAIVLRVNSSGGSAIASDILWHELTLAKNEKPVVVSMGDVAASGGYYISCMADSIYAQPTTITGSIGVIGLFMNLEGMFDKVGVTFDVEKTNRYADFLSGVRKPTNVEIAYWQLIVDSIYNTFVKRVDAGRDLNFSQIDAIGQGRIWSGADALRLGLVDRIGGLQDAVRTAKNMAGLDKYVIVELPEQEDAFQLIMKNLSGEVKQRTIERKLGQYSEYYNSLQKILNNQGVIARLPYDIYVY